MPDQITEAEEHPSFVLARSLPEPWRSHFPKSAAECEGWRPLVRRLALARRVLMVATTRIECAWAAYGDAVAGENHDQEWQAVLAHGAKLSERCARAVFPEFEEVPYAS